MLQFIYAVAIGAVVYTIGFAITDGMLVPISGFFFSLLVAGVFVLPLKALLRFTMPRATPQSRAVITGIVLMGLVTYATFKIPPEHLPSGRIGFFMFWLVYISTLVAGLFWPFSTHATDRQGPARVTPAAKQ